MRVGRLEMDDEDCKERKVNMVGGILGDWGSN